VEIIAVTNGSADLYVVMRSYLLRRTFRVKYGEVQVTQLKEINSGVPQDSVSELVLYLLYTADLPVALGSTTYADDTAVLAAR